MTFGVVATVVVAIGFLGLVVWVLLPRNRRRFERYGRIPLDSDDSKKGQ